MVIFKIIRLIILILSLNYFFIYCYAFTFNAFKLTNKKQILKVNIKIRILIFKLEKIILNNVKTIPYCFLIRNRA